MSISASYLIICPYKVSECCLGAKQLGCLNLSCNKIKTERKNNDDFLARAVWAVSHTKRQATKHNCLPSLLGDGNTEIEIVCDEEKNILYRADLSS